VKLKTRDLLVAAACAAAVAVPALASADQAPPTTATVTATDQSGDVHTWSSDDVTIAAGGTVTFRYPIGSSFHDVAFQGAQPASCTQTAGSNYGPVPPLPGAPQGPGWEGDCRFTGAGTYTFFCESHTYMRGTIHVVDPSASPTPTPTPTPGATATPAPTPAPGSDPAVTQTPLKDAVTLARTGSRVRGTVDVKLAGSRLEVTVWAPRKRIAGGRSSRPLRIGRTLNASAPAARVPFSVTLSAQARSALRRHRRLSVTVRIALTPPGGHKLTYSVNRTLRVS
jgi:plastocyanin